MAPTPAGTLWAGQLRSPLSRSTSRRERPRGRSWRRPVRLSQTRRPRTAAAPLAALLLVSLAHQQRRSAALERRDGCPNVCDPRRQCLRSLRPRRRYPHHLRSTLPSVQYHRDYNELDECCCHRHWRYMEPRAPITVSVPGGLSGSAHVACLAPKISVCHRGPVRDVAGEHRARPSTRPTIP